MPGGSGNKGDRGGGTGAGGGSNAGGGGGGSEGGSKNNVSGGMSAASHKGDTVSGRGHSAYGGGFASPGGYSNVTGQERMARIGDRVASASMSGFSNGTSSGAAPTGMGGGIGPGQGPGGMRAAQLGRDAFAAAQRAANATASPTASRTAKPTVAPRLSPPPPPPVLVKPTVIAPPTIAPPTVAPPPNIAQLAFAPTIARLQAPTTAVTSPNLAMNPGVVGVMSSTQVPGFSAPAPAPAAPNPNVGYADPGTLARPSPNPATNVGVTPKGALQSSTHSKTGPQPGDLGYVGRVTATERAINDAARQGAPARSGYGSPSTRSSDRAPAAPGLPGSAGDIGVGGVPGGVSARGTNSTNRGAPSRPGVAAGPSNAGYADAGSRFGRSTGLVGRQSDPGVAGVPGGVQGRGMAAQPGPRSDTRDPGMAGVPGGLQARGTSLAQKLAGDFARTAYGMANPAEVAALTAAAVTRGFSGMLTSPAFSPKQNAFMAKIAPAVMEAAVATGISPTVIGAMAALESAWGMRAPMNNLFGIKATKGWKGPTQSFMTKEQVGDQLAPMTDRFRAYSSWRDSIADFARLMGLSRYSAVNDAMTAQEQARAIARAGYATDRAYADKVGGIASRMGGGK